MTNLAERLQKRMDELGISQDKLAMLTKLSQAAIQKITSGKTREPRRIVQIAHALDCTPEWLLTGNSVNMDIGNKSIVFDNNISPSKSIRGQVPLISDVSAGNFQEAIDNYQPGDGERMIDVYVPVGRHTFALRVDGDSMEPEFLDGEIIIVEPDMPADHKDFVIAKNGGDATFKQLWKEGADWYLKPLNDRFPIKPLGDSHIIGVVREKTITKRYK